jgi:tetratricopeptide (TPR) repeat protein
MTGLLAVVLTGSGCHFAKRVIAKDKLNQGALLYNQGRTSEAAAYFKDVTELVPENPVGWLYYGKTLLSQFQSAGPDNRQSKADAALAAYQKALDLASNDCPTQSNAIAYIASIYDTLGKDDDHRQWLLKRAQLPCATKDTQSTTYYSIGVGYWKCSYDQTTRYADKVLAVKDPFHYRNMDYDAARPDKEKAEQCVTKGFEYIEKAIQVDPEYEQALFYKGLLYREKEKLTKDPGERKKYDDEAEKIRLQATAIANKKQEQKAAAEAAAASPKPTT